ncbi:hypothetical protein SAMN04515654_1156 [Halanaerobium congolense]|uniref:AbiJ N-terminal domain-containing protein n=1 Tax=Halanaerobium congolense TaxID=54121 RepID=A0A1G8NFL8_9FIRM|nr:hypothetical protein [Halanaerobium congolense]OEG62159.1 MAG: hypothetical protein BHK79_07190 [Halanaerobium sp. MDAL1]SDI79059.1 hypothetical protein SAMN04515654_1156 [Halanaerobium congolense]SET48585.1 hypothetical protein SAMN04515653_1166 [Halanaerobium congolense]
METRQLLARAVNLLMKETYYNDEYNEQISWNMHTQAFGVAEIAQNTRRLYRSQNFGDSDYPDIVMDLFINIFVDKGEEVAIDFTKHVLKNELNLRDEEIINKDRDLFHELNLISDDLEIIEYSSTKILNVGNYPDDFYEDLQAEINKAYNYRLYSSVFVLVRKLFENLVIDLLRKKYGMENVDLFFNPSKNRFYNFSNLIENLEEKQLDFRPAEPAINSKLIETINDFRQKGNSSAHSITLNIKKEDLDEEIDGLEHTIKILVRGLNNLG